MCIRDRREDIPMLFEHFLLQAAIRYNRNAPVVSCSQMRELIAHSWPGNVRELRNIADRFVLGIMKENSGMLSPQAVTEVPLAEQINGFERAMIEQELRNHSGNVLEACVALGLPKKTLYHKMQKYNLIAEKFKPSLP